MKTEKIYINGIPAVLWGQPSDKIYLHVHGKMSKKEYAAEFAQIAESKGYQTLSFDLPGHGERQDEAYECNIWNGIHDLTQVGDYVFERWAGVSLFACSLGAYFSLNTYSGRIFENCLFQSPVLDMEYLIQQMFLWFQVTENELREKKEIPTPIDTLSWDYYLYVKEHPIRVWTPPTYIMYGARDTLQSREVIDDFAQRFGCQLTVSDRSDHPFMEPKDMEIMDRWLREVI